MITALAGGVGAAKLLKGIAKIIPPESLIVIVNTGDDIQLHGLHISPDIDIATYTLAGIEDEEKGWGIKGDSFHCLDSLKRLTRDEWFNLGDKDLATHIFRTNLLRSGATLAEATEQITFALEIKSKILPMTNDKFETRIETPNGTMHFEEYMVKRNAKDEVIGVVLFGANKAEPAPGVIEAIETADKVVICPSNPIVSIGTILAVPGVRKALRETEAPKVAVSPIIAGAPVKGPADKLLRGMGREVSAFGVAELYVDFLDTFIIDTTDAAESERIEKLGIKVKVTNTLMRTLEDRINLAKAILEA